MTSEAIESIRDYVDARVREETSQVVFRTEAMDISLPPRIYSKVDVAERKSRDAYEAMKEELLKV